MACPCGSGVALETCCGPIIAGEKPASTPEAMMRARYTAYTQQAIDFLFTSLHPDSPGEADRRSTEAWAKYAKWHGLEIIGSSGGGEGEDEGIVEFVAKYSIKDTPQRHHERAVFRRHGKKWLYLDGKEIKSQPVSGPRLKPGRNDDCPCGSGRKFKKCCGPVWEAGARTPEQLVRARFAAQLAGEADYLTRSLHPDASQPADADESVTFAELRILKTSSSGTEEAEVESSYTESKAGKATQKQVRNICRQLGGKWLLAGVSAA